MPPDESPPRSPTCRRWLVWLGDSPASAAVVGALCFGVLLLASAVFGREHAKGFVGVPSMPLVPLLSGMTSFQIETVADVPRARELFALAALRDPR